MWNEGILQRNGAGWVVSGATADRHGKSKMCGKRHLSPTECGRGRIFPGEEFCIAICNRKQTRLLARVVGAKEGGRAVDNHECVALQVEYARRV